MTMNFLKASINEILVNSEANLELVSRVVKGENSDSVIREMVRNGQFEPKPNDEETKFHLGGNNNMNHRRFH